MAKDKERIVDRDTFTYDEKMLIAQKSDEMCCHCGKKVYFGFGATVDHYVPLSLGGTNVNENLVMLCEKCNKEKDNKLIEPRAYIHHLREKDAEKLDGYFRMAVYSSDYLRNTRLLALDEYKLSYHCPFTKDGLVTMKLADKEGDFHKILSAYIKYLDKNDCLESKDRARDNIDFFFKFGCIYYVEFGDEVKNLLVAVPSRDYGLKLNKENTELMDDVDKNMINYCISLFEMPIYKKPLYYNIQVAMHHDFCKLFLKEQQISYLPVRIESASSEYFYNTYRNGYKGNLNAFTHSGPVYMLRLIHYNEDKKLPDYNGKKQTKFMSIFEKGYRDVDAFFKHHPDILWMKESFLGIEENEKELER